jgi:hypothetical protein
MPVISALLEVNVRQPRAPLEGVLLPVVPSNLLVSPVIGIDPRVPVHFLRFERPAARARHEASVVVHLSGADGAFSIERTRA